MLAHVHRSAIGEWRREGDLLMKPIGALHWPIFPLVGKGSLTLTFFFPPTKMLRYRWGETVAKYFELTFFLLAGRYK